MVYLDLVGRCGNQLFQYAYARLLMQERADGALTVNTHELSINDGGDYWYNSLRLFNTIDFSEENSSIPSVMIYGSPLQKILYRVKCLLDIIVRNKESYIYIWLDKLTFSLFSQFGLYFLRMGYSAHRRSKAQNVFIYGYFEDKRWPDKVYDLIKIEVVPECAEESALLDFVNEGYEPVCMSLRRWELDVADVEERDNKNVCTLEYYSEAVRIIKNHIYNPLFYVCSDDIEWAKDKISDLLKGFKVIYETGDDSLAQKLYKMSSCKAFVLSNSTFCWWAQYLADQKDVLVISPSTWSAKSIDRHLIDDKWITIDTGYNHA